MDKVMFFIYHADIGILYHQFLVFYLIIAFSFCASQLLKNRTLLFFVYLTYCRTVAYVVGLRNDGTTFFAFPCYNLDICESQTRSSLHPICGLNFPIASTNRKKTSPSTYRFPRELFFSFLFFFTKTFIKVVPLLLDQTAYIRIGNSRRLKRESLVIIRECGLFLSFSFSPSLFSSPRPSGFIPFFLFCFPMGTFCALTLVPSSSRDAHNGALH